MNLERATLLLGAHVVLGCGDDLRANDAPPDGIAFAKLIVDDAYRAEGVAIFDVNRDGVYDFVTEEQWYEGPTYVAHELRSARQWDPTMEYSNSFGAFHFDVDKDGFEDLIVIGPPGGAATWCANPRGLLQHWSCHVITPRASGESPLFTHVLQTGEPHLLLGTEPDLQLGWLEPSAVPEAEWVMDAVTPPGFPHAARYEHGLGVGDLNRDLRIDIITGSGWLEQPADPTVRPWRWHPVTICPNNCSHMFVYDVNGDGLADVIGTSPHGYGVRWWEQRPAPLGELVYVEHMIDQSISQTHAARLVDLDGDAVPELVTGKRWYAHFTADPGALEPALLVYYRMERKAGEVWWSRHVIDDDSGVGTQFEVFDVNQDHKPDVVIANKKGLIYFEQQ